MTLSAEKTIDIAVFMSRQAHVVDIGGRHDIIGKGHGAIPETEIVYSIRTLGNGEKRLAVVALHTDYKKIFPVPFHCAGIERCVHSYTLHEIGISGGIEIVTPHRGNHLGRDDRIFISLINSVALQGSVRTCHKLFIASEDEVLAIFECIHCIKL